MQKGGIMRNDYGLRHQHEKGSFKQNAQGSGGGKRLMGGTQGKGDIPNKEKLDNMTINKKGQPLTKHVKM